MAITKSSGREPWIFRVDKPEDLVGAHRELIASALQPDETIHHLIYSPAWEGTEAPFGIRGQSASHSIAVTPTRWIVSENRHVSWLEPRVHSIPFDDVLVVEKGSALLLAWLVIRFRDGESLRSLTILHKAIGAHHFDDAIRTYRRLAAGEPLTAPIRGGSEEWQQIPRYLAQELMPILIDGEHVLASTHTAEQWHEKRRRWRRTEFCAQPWSAFLVTDHGLLYAEAEKPERPDLLSFGSNVWCAPSGAFRMSRFVEKNGNHCLSPTLRLTFTRGSVRHDFDAAVPSEEAIGNE